LSQIKQIVKWMGDSGQTVGKFNNLQTTLYAALVIEEAGAEMYAAIYGEDTELARIALEESSLLREASSNGVEYSYGTETRVLLADAAADTIVVAVGLLNSLGVDPEAVLAEVIRSNESKRQPDGTLLKDASGKIQKGPNYTPPNIEQFFKKPRQLLTEADALADLNGEPRPDWKGDEA